MPLIVPLTMRQALFATVFLAACAGTRSACLARADAELRALDAEIAATESALARGYRLAPRSGLTVGAAICAENRPLTLCLGGERPLGERRTAIDPAAERARLASLRADRSALATAANRAAEDCPPR